MNTNNTETKKNNGSEAATTTKMYAQKLAIYHPNSSGSGAAMQMEPRLNRQGSDRYNCFFLDMAPQKTAATRDGGRMVPASFDWEHKLTVKLHFTDICEMLAVLEGRAEKIGGAQKSGLFHRNGNSSTVISLQKAEKGGYFLGLSKKSAESDTAVRVNITLSEAEAIGLRSIFQAGLFFITFHAQMFPVAA